MGVAKRKAQKSESSSDEYNSDTGYCTIEWFHASKDSWRVVAGISYPTLWPYDTDRVSENTYKVVDQIRGRYEAILTRWGLTLRLEKLQSISPKYSAQYTDTLLLLLTADEDRSNWPLAANDIQDLIQDAVRNQREGEKRIRVELRNQVMMYRDYSSVVWEGTPEHTALLRTVDPIKKAAKQVCFSHLTTVTWVMRGRPGDEGRKPTVMVTVKPGAQSLWHLADKHLQDTIEEICGDDVGVELVPGSLLQAVSAEMAPTQPLAAYKIRIPPDLGASIGPRKSKAAGTLGPWVHFEIKVNKELLKMKGFLTCHHVISPGDPENRIVNDREGIGLRGKSPVREIIIDYPAPFDTSKTLAKYTEEIARGYDVAENQKSLDTFGKVHASGGLGKVMYSSGSARTNDSGSKMDWAFVSVNDDALFGKNITATKENTGGPIDRDMLYNDTIKYDVPGHRITKTGVLKKGSWVAKFGRTSGVTAGHVNAINAYCEWNDGLKTSEIHLLNSDVNEAHPLLMAGDSGAMMWNELGEWVGLGIGNITQDATAIVTSTTELVADILRVTRGGVVTLE